ncbi:MAG: hypothetical protein IPK19_13525 [Chloroflexi bacterium]|nr:hypothetical protein [Chloroflexota bacterium]
MLKRTGLTVASLLLAFLIFASGFAGVHPAQAQDETPVVCDSTLMLLLYIAEHDYDYLSSQIDSEMGVPNVDFGQYDLIINETMAMMMDMMGEMSEEEMAEHTAMEEMMAPLMAMDVNGILGHYAETMMMEGSSMTTLEPGVVAGEPELCTSLREDVSRFLIAHLVTSTEMMMGRHVASPSPPGEHARQGDRLRSVGTTHALSAAKNIASV